MVQPCGRSDSIAFSTAALYLGIQTFARSILPARRRAGPPPAFCIRQRNPARAAWRRSHPADRARRSRPAWWPHLRQCARTVRCDRATRQRRSVRSARRAHKSAARQRRRKTMPAAGSSRRYLCRGSPRPSPPRPPPLSRRSNRPARDPAPADCAPGRMRNFHSTSPSRTRRSSACPTPPRPPLSASRTAVAVVRRRVALQNARPGGRRHTLNRDHVLDADGHACQADPMGRRDVLPRRCPPQSAERSRLPRRGMR